MLKQHAVRLNDERGSLVVEMGLIVMPMVSLIMILFLVGIALNIQVGLTNAAREGVRVYALEGRNPTSAWQDAAENGATVGALHSITGGWMDAAGNRTVDGDCTPATDAGATPPIDVYVRVEKTFGWTLPGFLGGGVFGFGPGNPMAGQAVMRCGG